jgi:hypothetical protein
MTDTETALRQQEFEQVSLQSTVSNLQAALLYATGESRKVLETAYRNASGRLATVETKVKDLQGKHEEEVKEESTRAATLVAQETRLSAQEKETFGGFMKKDFFTKADFGRLEDFYKKSYDRLSEHGKDEMSHRIWEGIRKHEYTFSELPADVREKEMRRAYGALTKQTDQSANVARIPESDRKDFIHAFETGHTAAAAKILQRPSFTQNMNLSPESKAREHSVANQGHEADRVDVSAHVADSKPQGLLQKAPESAKAASKDLAAFGLDGAKLVDVQSQGTSSELPRGQQRSTGQGKSTPGG